LIDEILMTSLSDNVKARELLSNGSYRRIMPGKDEKPIRSQERFLELAAASAARRLLPAPAPRPTPPEPRPLRRTRRRQRQTN
jgi:polyphosphate kinase